jgi:hypothetical protein
MFRDAPRRRDVLTRSAEVRCRIFTGRWSSSAGLLLKGTARSVAIGPDLLQSVSRFVSQ